MSPSSNGAPHSGQNFGGWVGSSGSQPHLSHLYFGVPAGFGRPHSEQNLPLFTAPHTHVQPSGVAGRGRPQLPQNLPVLPVWPQAHVQLPAAGAAGCWAACCRPMA